MWKRREGTATKQELSWTQKKLKQEALSRRLTSVAMMKGPWELHQAGLAAWWEVDQLHGDMGTGRCCSARSSLGRSRLF